MSKVYLTPGIIKTIGRLRERPVDAQVADYLLSLYGEDGEVARIAAIQRDLWSGCPGNDGRICFDHSCGACAPWRDGPLLDEVLKEIRLFEGGFQCFDEKGDVRELDRGSIPF